MGDGGWWVGVGCKDLDTPLVVDGVTMLLRDPASIIPHRKTPRHVHRSVTKHQEKRRCGRCRRCGAVRVVGAVVAVVALVAVVVVVAM